MRHRLSQLLHWGSPHTSCCLLARAACDHVLVRSTTVCDSNCWQKPRSADGTAAVQQEQQHHHQQQQQQQQQQRWLSLLCELRWLSRPAAHYPHLLATQQPQQQEKQQGSAQPNKPDAQGTSSSSSSTEKSSSEGASSSNSSSGNGDAAGDSSTSSSSSSGSSSSSKEPPDEALLAEWRSASAQWYGNGLNYVLHGHLEVPSMSSWAYLYRKQPSLLSQLIWPKGASAMTRLLHWNFAKSRQVAVPLLEEAHGDFEAEEFTQCASQAIAAVLELYAAANWAELRPMVSSGLLKSMQQAYEDQEDHQSVSNVASDIDKLDIACVHSITQQQLAAIDEQRAGQQLTPAELEAAAGAAAADGAGAAATAAAGQAYWDVCHVYVEATWRADVKLGDGDGAASQVVQPRSGHWVLARGPVLLNKPIPAEADKPWFMLAWM